MGCSDLPGRARWVVWPCLCFLATENARKAFPSHSHGLPTCTMDLAWTPQSGPSWLCPPLPLDSSTLQSLRLRSATPGEGGGPGLSVANSSRAWRGGFCQDLWLSGHWSTPGLQAWPAPGGKAGSAASFSPCEGSLSGKRMMLFYRCPLGYFYLQLRVC